MFAFIHEVCGKPAFYLSEMPKRGERVSSAAVVVMRGERPQPGDPILCGSCGEPVTGTGNGNLPTANVREVA